MKLLLRSARSLAAALTLVSTPVMAAAVTAPDGTATSPAAKPSSDLALSRRMIEVMGLRKTLDAMFESMVPLMLENASKRRPSPPAEWRQAMEEAIVEALRARQPEFLERVAALYADAFTTEEIKAVIAFYESPAGRSMLAKSPALMQHIGPLSEELQKGLTEDILGRLCAKVDCRPETAPSSNPS